MVSTDGYAPTMSNPARRLFEIYSTWADSYSPQRQAIDVRRLNDPKGIAKQMEAFRLLISIEYALDYLGRKNASVEVYRAQFPEWVKMAIHAPNNWTSGSSAQTGFPAGPMSHLNTFATLLDFDQPGLQPEPEAKLRNVIQEVMDLLIADESLSPHLREYVFKLVNEIRTALDDESISGSFDFAEGAHRLWVAVFAAAGQSKNMRIKWRHAASDLFRDAGAAALGSLPSMGLTIAQIAAATTS
jgi:hypothetical protein